jgi:hypothetical protein
MKKIIIGLVALSSISSFAQSNSVLERTVKIIAGYTPLSAEQILSSELSLNRRIVDNYISKGFTGHFDSALVDEFGTCAEGPDAKDKRTTILMLAKQIEKSCGL